MEQRIAELTKARGDDLLQAGRAALNLNDKLDFFKQAHSANPASIEIFKELGVTQRKLSEYVSAIETFRNGLRLNPDDPILHRELGITFSKAQQLPEAIIALREAVRLAPADAEAWSNLGGVLRRIGMKNAPQSFDDTALKQSRECYAQAHALDKYNLYSSLNVSRLDLLLSKWESSRANLAKEGFSKQVHLCHHEVQESPNDFWRKFDLMDSLLFSGKYVEAISECENAISNVPMNERNDVLPSVLGPLENFISAGVLDSDTLSATELIVQKIQSAIK